MRRPERCGRPRRGDGTVQRAIAARSAVASSSTTREGRRAALSPQRYLLCVCLVERPPGYPTTPPVVCVCVPSAPHPLERRYHLNVCPLGSLSQVLCATALYTCAPVSPPPHRVSGLSPRRPRLRPLSALCQTRARGPPPCARECLFPTPTPPPTLLYPPRGRAYPPCTARRVPHVPGISVHEHIFSPPCPLSLCVPTRHAPCTTPPPPVRPPCALSTYSLLFSRYPIWPRRRCENIAPPLSPPHSPLSGLPPPVPPPPPRRDRGAFRCVHPPENTFARRPVPAVCPHRIGCAVRYRVPPLLPPPVRAPCPHPPHCLYGPVPPPPLVVPCVRIPLWGSPQKAERRACVARRRAQPPRPPPGVERRVPHRSGRCCAPPPHHAPPPPRHRVCAPLRLLWPPGRRRRCCLLLRPPRPAPPPLLHLLLELLGGVVLPPPPVVRPPPGGGGGDPPGGHHHASTPAAPPPPPDLVVVCPGGRRATLPPPHPLVVARPPPPGVSPCCRWCPLVAVAGPPSPAASLLRRRGRPCCRLPWGQPPPRARGPASGVGRPGVVGIENGRVRASRSRWRCPPERRRPDSPTGASGDPTVLITLFRGVADAHPGMIGSPVGPTFLVQGPVKPWGSLGGRNPTHTGYGGAERESVVSVSKHLPGVRGDAERQGRGEFGGLGGFLEVAPEQLARGAQKAIRRGGRVGVSIGPRRGTLT